MSAESSDKPARRQATVVAVPQKLHPRTVTEPTGQAPSDGVRCWQLPSLAHLAQPLGLLLCVAFTAYTATTGYRSQGLELLFAVLGLATTACLAIELSTQHRREKSLKRVRRLWGWVTAPVPGINVRPAEDPIARWAYAPLATAAVAILAFFATTGFGALSAFLCAKGITATHPAHAIGTRLADSGFGYYFWNLVQAIPGLDLPSVFAWKPHFTFTDHLSPVLLLIYKVAVAGPVIATIAQVWRRKTNDSVDQEPASAQPTLSQVA